MARSQHPGIDFLPGVRREEGWRLLVIALAYLVAHKFAYFVPGSGEVIMAIWPASGVALAALLLLPRRMWAAILIAVSATHGTVELASGRSPLGELGFVLANVIETGGSAWLICRRTVPPITFGKLSVVLRLLLAATVINAGSSLLGAASAWYQSGGDYWTLYRTWFVADGLGLLLVTPLLVSWLGPAEPELTQSRWLRTAEIVVAFTATLALAGAFFGLVREMWWVKLHSYMLMIPLAWTALRLGFRATTTVLALLAAVSVGLMVAGFGGFPLGGDTSPERVLWVQLFLGANAVVALLLAASLAERQATETSLRASEEKASRVFRSSPVAIALTRVADGRFVEVNKAMETFLGNRREELIGRTTLDLEIWRSDRDREQVVAELSQKGGIENRELAFRTQQGGEAIAQYSAELLELHGERCILSVLADVTARKRAELDLLKANAALRASEERFRSAMEHSPAGMAIVSLEGRWLAVNQALSNIVGYTREELLRLDLRAITHPDDLGGYLETVQRLVSGSLATLEREKRYIRKDGHIAWIQLNSSLMRGEDGSPQHFIAQFLDITRRKAMEAERDRLVHDLGERVKELTALHRTGRLLQRDRPFDQQLLAELVELLPPAWQFPEICAARITFEPWDARTTGWKETP